MFFEKYVSSQRSLKLCSNVESDSRDADPTGDAEAGDMPNKVPGEPVSSNQSEGSYPEIENLRQKILTILKTTTTILSNCTSLYLYPSTRVRSSFDLRGIECWFLTD